MACCCYSDRIVHCTTVLCIICFQSVQIEGKIHLFVSTAPCSSIGLEQFSLGFVIAAVMAYSFYFFVGTEVGGIPVGVVGVMSFIVV